MKDLRKQGKWQTRALAFVHRFSASHEGFEAADLFAGTEDDEGVVGEEPVLGRRGRIELAPSTADGEDHGAGLLPDL
jgi:hypothetical protein